MGRWLTKSSNELDVSAAAKFGVPHNLLEFCIEELVGFRPVDRVIRLGKEEGEEVLKVIG